MVQHVKFAYPDGSVIYNVCIHFSNRIHIDLTLLILSPHFRTLTLALILIRALHLWDPTVFLCACIARHSLILIGRILRCGQVHSHEDHPRCHPIILIGHSLSLTPHCYCALGDLQPTDGAVRRHSHLKLALYHQHLAEILDLELSPLEFMQREFPDDFVEIEKARSAVGRYGLTGKQQV
jgi:hypothetical protein